MNIKSSRAILLACLVLTIAAACSKKTASGPAATTTPATPPPVAAADPGMPVEADANRALMKFPGTTLPQLVEGRTIYNTNCGRCHKLFKPTDFNEAQWRNVVPPMAQKARLDAAAESKVLAYVVTMSQAK
jgi:cytochrome c5